MSNAVVFIFLLDSFSDIKNTTNEISTIKPLDMNLVDGLQLCNSKTVDQTIEMISKRINRTISKSREYSKDSNYESTDIFDDLSIDNFNNIDTLVDRSLLDTEKSLELTQNFLENKNKDDASKHGYIVSETFLKNSEILLERAPFLVAIFESLSNVTAQTCAATLLSPHWVLTAADCVDVLPTLYSDKTKITEKSHYTIVVNSTDPFIDGVVHNVTKIIFYPYNFSPLQLLAPNRTNKIYRHHTTVKAGNQKIKKKPSLALMRVEPPVIEGKPLEIMRGELGSDIEVKVYGWISIKNESGQEIIRMKSLQTKLVNTSECIDNNHSDVNPDSIFCFSSTNETRDVLSEMSSGGPVLMRDNKVIAVAQADEHGYLRAYLLPKHSIRIENILTEDETL